MYCLLFIWASRIQSIKEIKGNFICFLFQFRLVHLVPFFDFLVGASGFFGFWYWELLLGELGNHECIAVPLLYHTSYLTFLLVQCLLKEMTQAASSRY